MGIFQILPPGLVQLFTWIVLFIAGSSIILLAAILVGPVFGDFLDGIFGWLK